MKYSLQPYDPHKPFSGPTDRSALISRCLARGLVYLSHSEQEISFVDPEAGQTHTQLLPEFLQAVRPALAWSSSLIQHLLEHGSPEHGRLAWPYGFVSAFRDLQGQWQAVIQCPKCQTRLIANPLLSHPSCSACPTDAPASTVGLTYHHGNISDFKEHSGMLYIVKLQDQLGAEEFIKIGITKHDLSVRKPGWPAYQVIKQKTYEMSVYDAYWIEQLLKREFKSNKYYPRQAFSGHTECLSTAVGRQVLNRIDYLLEMQGCDYQEIYKGQEVEPNEYPF